MGTAGFGGSFAPIVQYEKWEIHKVFPHFSYFRLRQNLSPNLLAPLCGAALEKSHIGIGRYDKCIVRTCHSEPVRTLVWESPSIFGQSIVIQFVLFVRSPGIHLCVIEKWFFYHKIQKIQIMAILHYSSATRLHYSLFIQKILPLNE